MEPKPVLLLVTRDPMYRDYFVGRTEGASVRVADSGARALVDLLECRPDVLLLDLEGLDLPAPVLLRTAKRQRRRIATVILSPSPSVEGDAGILEEGVLFYSAKPPDPSEVEPVLAAAFASVEVRRGREPTGGRSGKEAS